MQKLTINNLVSHHLIIYHRIASDKRKRFKNKISKQYPHINIVDKLR